MSAVDTSIPWRARLGALTERDYRLLFSATTITTIGDRLAGIALVFAVLDLGSLKLEPLDAGNALFMPDGSFAVVRRIQGKSMLFAEQSGRPRKQLFAGDEEFILNGAAARDGRIAFAKGTSTSDVVLIKAK